MNFQLREAVEEITFWRKWINEAEVEKDFEVERDTSQDGKEKAGGDDIFA